MLVMLDGILFQSLLSLAQRNNCSNLVWSVVRYKLEDEICGFAFRPVVASGFELVQLSAPYGLVEYAQSCDFPPCGELHTCTTLYGSAAGCRSIQKRVLFESMD